MIHNTSHRGSAGFPCNAKFDVDDLCTDIFLNKKVENERILFKGYAEFGY